MMTYYDYKVVPAPRRAKKVKGISGTQDLFALTLTETINEIARQGWEYYRSESMPSEAPAGWFRRAVAEEQTMLVFRKPREHLSPRLAAAPPDVDAGPREGREDEHRPRVVAEPPMADRIPGGGVMRRAPSPRLEPRLGEARLGEAPPSNAAPSRAMPQLGPADKS